MYLVKKIIIIFIALCLNSCSNVNKNKIELANNILSTKDKHLIDKMVIDKRMVFLGEPDHWIKEKGNYQLAIIKYLASKGFNIIANERSHLDSKYIDSYIQTGDKKFLKRCGECGYKDKKWPKRSIKGTLAASTNIQREYIRRMRKNDHFFFDALNTINKSNELTYVGYDVDKVADILFDYLEPLSSRLSKSKNHNCQRISKLAQRSSNGNLVEESNNLKKVKALLNKCISKDIFSEDEKQKFKKVFNQTYESIKFAEVAFNNPSNQELMSAYTEREFTMYRIMNELLSDVRNKVIILGHNAHLSFDEKEYRRISKIKDKTIEVPNWKTLGSFLRNNYRSEILSIWMLAFEGTHSAPFCQNNIPCKFSSPLDSIESKLNKDNYTGLIPVSLITKRYGKKLLWRENGINTVTGNLEKCTDLIFYSKKNTGF